MFLKKMHPAKLLVIGYLAYSIVGWLLLLIPICHTNHVSALDNFFVSLSAVSTTGLTTINISKEYSIWGQIVILLLVQLGGIGYLTLSSFVVLTVRHKISSFRKKIAAASFALPHGFSLYRFLYLVVIFTFVCEVIGAFALSLIFWQSGVDASIWNGLFYSVASFCTDGFSLFNDSLTAFRYNAGLIAVISLLSIFGSMGFIVFYDFYEKLKGNLDAISFTTKIILAATLSFLLLGTLIFLFLAEFPPEATMGQRWLIAFFQVMAAMTTAGFNTVDIGALFSPILLSLMFISLFGTSPSGTGGGLKNTTFATLLGLVKSLLQGKRGVVVWRRDIPSKAVHIATATSIAFGFVFGTALFFITITEHHPFLPLLYETMSALSNQGMSMGITPDLTSWGKAIMCILMLVGRTGVLTFGIAISSQGDEETHQKKEDLAL